MRGRRPDNPAVQEAKGNPGKRGKRKTIDDVIDAAPLPDGTPSHLSEHARKFWKLLAPELTRLNFVRMTDRPALERYCETLAEYWANQLQLRGKPRIYWTDTLHGKMKRVEPAFLLLQRVEKMLFDYEDRIGLNPAARQRILLSMAAGQGRLPFDPPRPNDEKDGETPAQGEGDGRDLGKPDSPVGLLDARRVH